MEKDTTTKSKVEASECAQNCICQTESGEPGCKITGTVSNSIFFTESRYPGGCAHQHAFGSIYICTCPIRQELYLKQKI